MPSAFTEVRAGQGPSSGCHPYRSRLPPVADGVSRPLWSVMIPTYNCANYLRETLASVLAQDPGSDAMQIEVVDDDSTRDDPEKVVVELGRGRVGFYRQRRNVGHTRNFQTCLELARGHLIHLLHGDDCIREGFYRKLHLAFKENPRIGAAFCRHIYVDERGRSLGTSALEQAESGILRNWLERIAVKQRIQTPSIVVRREVYETLGVFDSRLAWVEDWEMWVRIAAHYPVWYEVEPLALYRMHADSSSGRHTRTGENLRDVRRAIEIIRSYLSVGVADSITERSREHWAVDAIVNRVPEILRRGDLHTATVQVREALRCNHSPPVLRLLAPVALQMGILWIRSWIQR